MQDEIARQKSASLAGRIETILVEGRSKTDDARLTGRTESNRLVHFIGEDGLIDRKVRVRIDRGEPHALYGTLLDTP